MDLNTETAAKEVRKWPPACAAAAVGRAARRTSNEPSACARLSRSLSLGHACYATRRDSDNKAEMRRAHCIRVGLEPATLVQASELTYNGERLAPTSAASKTSAYLLRFQFNKRQRIDSDCVSCVDFFCGFFCSFSSRRICLTKG